MTFIVIIPARLGSTRLPEKALADIGGLPMVIRVAQQAQLSSATRVIVATDHMSIAHACAHYQVEYVLTDTELNSGTDRLAQAAKKLGLPQEAMLVNVQGDEPFVNPLHIDELAMRLEGISHSPMATLVTPFTRHDEWTDPNCVKVVLNAQQDAIYFSRSPIPYLREQHNQTLPSPHAFRHIGMYAYRCHFLHTFTQLPPAPLEQIESLEQLRAIWHGHTISAHITHDHCLPGVDTPQDLERARRWVAQVR